MDSLSVISLSALGVSLAGILLVFLVYPLCLWLCARRRAASQAEASLEPRVSMLVAVRNAEACIGEKIQNSLGLDYPEERLEIVVVSDGSTDATEAIVRSVEGRRVKLRASSRHDGKTEALNQGIHSCSGEIVVFSDADAILERGALRKLIRHFSDSGVGGVCGQRGIQERKAALEAPQSRYIEFDSAIKVLESRSGSITSNDGKLYAIRKELFRPIAEAVTDDLYVALGVVRAGYRFVFEPEARAFVRLPSRNPAHEIERRKRIVSRSLRGILLTKELLNPFRYGMYAFGLAVNKVVRRLLPLCLLLLLAGTLGLSWRFPAMRAAFAAQALFYLLALSYPLVHRGLPPGLERAAALPFYFCVGNYGTLLGLIDFARGRKITKWDPKKTD
jgi:cellulose synthase/poly-beta-1,6-N-acetylglucosamine synthase-like glycosyltransferase